MILNVLIPKPDDQIRYCFCVSKIPEIVGELIQVDIDLRKL